MDQKIKHALQRLERENLIIEIKDIVTGASIVNKKDGITASKMIGQSGSIDDWLIDHVQVKGYQEIQLQLFSPRGNTAVREGVAVNMGFGEKQQPEVNRTVEPPPQTASPTPGLHMPGLGYADHLGLLVDRKELERVSGELKIQKEKTEQLTKEKDLLEEEKRSLEKSNDNKVFWGDLVKEVAPALKGFASMAMQSPGLNAPNQQPSLTIPEGSKGELIQAILQSEGITKEQVHAAYYMLEAFSNNNVAFAQALEQLFIQHKIKNDGNSNSEGQ